MIFPTQLTGKVLQSSTLTKDAKVAVVMLGDGKSTRAGIGKNPFFDVWACQWILRQTDYNTFINFYQQHGLVRAFTWTTPLGDTANFIFDSAPVISYDGVMNYTVNASFREVQESVL